MPSHYPWNTVSTSSKFRPTEYSEPLPPSNTDGPRITTITNQQRESARCRTPVQRNSSGARSTGKPPVVEGSKNIRSFLSVPPNNSRTNRQRSNPPASTERSRDSQSSRVLNCDYVGEEWCALRDSNSRPSGS